MLNQTLKKANIMENIFIAYTGGLAAGVASYLFASYFASFVSYIKGL